MKLTRIYVGGRLALPSGSYATAVLPAQRGEKDNYVLTEKGVLSRLHGNRIKGQGVPRFLEQNGFSLATEDHPAATALAELVDVREGVALFEAATVEQAGSYQSFLAGKTMKVVPFEADKSVYSIRVKALDGDVHQVSDLVAGLLLGGLKNEHQPGHADTYTVMDGWLRTETHDADASFHSPRLTDYGGPVEKACYLLCAAGLAVLVGETHLEDGIEEDSDAPFPKGFLTLALTNGATISKDALVVGITSVDTISVVYERDGEELYRRADLSDYRMSSILGFLLAPVIRVREMDAAQKTEARRHA